MRKFDKRINEANEKRIDLTVSDRRFFLIEGVIDDLCEFLFLLLGVVLVVNNLLSPSNFVVLYMYKDRVNFLFNYFGYMIY